MKSALLFILIGVFVGLLLVFFKRKGTHQKHSMRVPDRDFPYQWRRILEDKIGFYQRLSRSEKLHFETKTHIFLLNVHIVGVNTEINDVDRILVAASAIIPIFGFPNWHYMNLKEVEIYPTKFPIPESNKMAKGLTGWGAMEGKMMLSKKALHEGYYDENDQINVAIHEFIHMLDKQDGTVDGVLDKVMKEIDVLPWLHLIHQKMEEIERGDSTIRDYGKTNKKEFLAVVGEFFFESPDKMKVEHPALYSALDSIFNPTKARKGGKYSR